MTEFLYALRLVIETSNKLTDKDMAMLEKIVEKMEEIKKMKCPYRKETILIKTVETESTVDTFADCYEEECRLFCHKTNSCLRAEAHKAQIFGTSK